MTAGPNATPISRRALAALCLLSAATLAFEINLTRLYSVAQFYHFAFMIVSLALLGFGASGTALAVFPGLGRLSPGVALSRLSLATSAAILGAYLLTNGAPFDSFSIAWDRRQALILALHYAALSAPFFFSGMAVGVLLAAQPQAAGRTYAANLLGAAAGCLVALAAPARLGGEGTVVVSSGLAALAAVSGDGSAPSRALPPLIASRAIAAGLVLLALADSGLRLSGRASPTALDLRLSPYKALSYALQYPGAQVVHRRWNAFSRVDLVRSPGVRSLPGLSYRYLLPPPAEDGLLVDGDDLSPIVRPDADLGFADYLPLAIAFRLRPAAEALILEPRGGLDVTAALTLGARRVTAVEVNPLIVEAAASVYADPRVSTVVEADRSYLRRSRQSFDVVVPSLASSYHPVRSGAYSLAEDYRYTVEAFQDSLARLKPDGLLVVTRWLQMPPSESLRAFALGVAALESSGRDPREHVVAFRGYNTATLLVKASPFTADELQAVRDFAADRAFDLTFAPGLRPEESNRFNLLPEPIYYQTFAALLDARPRDAFFDAYPFDVRPPTDDRPFFGHFFKWSQAGQVLAELGKTWQPFGGAGYFVILALLALALAMATALIVLPVLAVRWRRDEAAEIATARSARLAMTGPPGAGRVGQPPMGQPPRSAALRGPWQGLPLQRLAYFALIGVAFLLVEIALIQRFILFLGQPAYALTAVLFSLLLFSGLGSRWSARLPLRAALAALAVVLLVVPALLPPLFARSLGLPLAWRLVVTAIALAPMGFLMGIPFPAGLGRAARGAAGPALVPWAWAVNGAASVVSAVLAALLALSFGFGAVLMLGALAYAGAWVTAAGWARPDPAPRPGR